MPFSHNALGLLLVSVFFRVFVFCFFLNKTQGGKCSDLSKDLEVKKQENIFHFKYLLIVSPIVVVSWIIVIEGILLMRILEIKNILYQ